MPAPRLTPEIEELERRRHELAGRGAWLPPNAARKKVLRAELASITRRALQLELSGAIVRPVEEPEDEGRQLGWWQT